MKLVVRGTWPDKVVLRHRWARAEARPWNQDSPHAHLRLVRGSDAFLEACADRLLRLGVEGVLSPPLPSMATRAWRHSGFEPYLYLDLYRRDLEGPVPEPGLPVSRVVAPDWSAMEAMDREAFQPLWRMDKLGLQEALEAVPQSSVLIAQDEAAMIGFVISGVSSRFGYLQRVAVHPEHQGQGWGRALVRASLRWARKRGARTMLLNTQPENQVAAALYRAEGFTEEPRALQVLRKTPHAESA